MNNHIKILIYKIIPSWFYYRIALFVKKRRLKISNKIFFNRIISKPIFDILKKKKNNEKAFIFGGGSSINELTPGNFDEINSCYSIGINMWIFHNFIPNCYMIELTNDDTLNEKYRLRILSLLKNRLKNPIFLIHKGLSNPIKVRKWMKGMSSKRVFLYEYIRPDIFKIDIKSEFIKLLKFIKKNKKSNILALGIGATIERAISLPLLLGYSKIIILGVDLKNTKYFWNDKDSNFKGLKTGQKINGPHLTATKRFGGVPVQKSILIMDKVARQHYGSRILISTKKSLLSSKLEKYKWQNK